MSNKGFSVGSCAIESLLKPCEANGITRKEEERKLGRGRGILGEKTENRADPSGTYGNDMGGAFDPHRKRGRALGPIAGVSYGLTGVVQSVGGDVESCLREHPSKF